MQHNWPLLLVTFLLPLLVGFNIQASPTVQKQTTPIRIVSLVPSITETLFALQLPFLLLKSPALDKVQQVQTIDQLAQAGN